MQTPEELYLANERLVYGAIGKYFPTCRNDEDTGQVGKIGLWKACLSYDPSRCSTFSVYAYQCIRNEVLMDFRKRSSNARFYKTYLSLDEKLDDDLSQVNFSELLMDCTNDGWLDRTGFVCSLDQRQTMILGYLILGYTQKEISEKIGLCQPSISRAVGDIRKKFDQYI